MNIRQTDLLEYIVKKFNTNSFNIPFRMGTFGLTEDLNGLVIYAPTRDNQGEFDRIETFDEETYQVDEKAFVVMAGNIDSGEYVALPNIKMATYSVTVEFLVYIDTPISEVIRMAIEEIRDRFIGNMDTIDIKEIDFDNDDTIKDDTLKVVTTADGLDFGQVIEIKGKKYLNYSFTVTMNVSKNVDFGNQIKWGIYKNLTQDESNPPIIEPTEDDYDINTTAQDGSVWKGAVDETEWALLEETLETYDFVENNVSNLPEIIKPLEGQTALILSWNYLGMNLLLTENFDIPASPPDYTPLSTEAENRDFVLNILNTEFNPVNYENNIGTIVKAKFTNGDTLWFEIKAEYYEATILNYQWVFVSPPQEYKEFIPLIWSWGQNQDIEPFQNLRPYATVEQKFLDRAKEVHNYVRSRGFGTTFTFLLDTKDFIIRDLFKQTFEKLEFPPVYSIQMIMQELDEDNEFIESADLNFERKMVYGEAQIGETSYGEPIVFSIGFVPSAKDV